MKGKKKKLPDSIVYDGESEKYDAFLKPYATSVSSPKIDVSGLALFKQRAAIHSNHKFGKRAEEIKEQISSLLREFEDNELVWNSNMSFEAHIGTEIYLYENSKGEVFSSLISPGEWGRKIPYYGHFKLDTDYSWKRIKDKDERS
jgi:hypothetical protein